MKDKVIKQLYDFWSKTDNDNAKLLEEITNNVNNGLDGAKVLLDWCRNEYDTIKEQYKKLHNLTDTEMGKVMEENHGSYEFMYNEIPYAIDLEDIWNICNWYLDYCNKDMTDYVKQLENGLIKALDELSQKEDDFDYYDKLRELTGFGNYQALDFLDMFSDDKDE